MEAFESSELIDWLRAPAACEPEWLRALEPNDDSNIELGSCSSPVSGHGTMRGDAFISSLLADGSGSSLTDTNSPGHAPPARAPSPRNAECGGSTHPYHASAELHALVSSLPSSYLLTTSTEERVLHLGLLKQLRIEGPDAMALTSWIRCKDHAKDSSGNPIIRLHAVFRDRCSSAPSPASLLERNARPP